MDLDSYFDQLEIQEIKTPPIQWHDSCNIEFELSTVNYGTGEPYNEINYNGVVYKIKSNIDRKVIYTQIRGLNNEQN